MLAALGCAASLLTWQGSAHAFELFGICFSGECKQEEEAAAFIDPKTYEAVFIVDETFSTDVEDALKSSSELWRGRDKPVAGSAGLIARAKGDYRRILAGLYNQGHYGGSISIEVNGQQAASMRAGTDLPGNSSVSILIEPGPVYRFGQAEIVNQAPFTDDPKDQVPLPEDVGFQTGETAKAGAVRRAEKVAREAWRQQGYPLAQTGNKSATAIHPENKLDVLIHMAPGPKASFGDVTVSGTERMDPSFVSYMTGIERGREYDPDEVEKAQKRLDRLGVFASRKLEESQSLDANGLLPIDLAVSERKLRRIGIGATASSIDGFGVEAFWLHRNLWGRAESLRLDGKVGGIGNTTDADEFDYLFSATLTQPGKFSPDTDLVWNAFVKHEFNDTYEENSGGGSIALTNYYSDEITYTLSAFGKYGDYVDAFGNRTFVTAGFEGDVIYDSRDSKTDPTKGFYAEVKASPFQEFEFGNTAIRIETELRGYHSLDTESRSVLAGRVKLGSLLGPSIVQTPPDLLFTAGGGNSIRGFAFKSIGVPAPGGNTSGGRSLFESSLEYRQRINDQFGLVAFVDAGTVNSGEFVDFEEDLSVGAGVGVRYYTGLGPIRLDFAVPLNPGPDDPDFAFYAGIGQAF